MSILAIIGRQGGGPFLLPRLGGDIENIRPYWIRRAFKIPRAPHRYEAGNGEFFRYSHLGACSSGNCSAPVYESTSQTYFAYISAESRFYKNPLYLRLDFLRFLCDFLRCHIENLPRIHFRPEIRLVSGVAFSICRVWSRIPEDIDRIISESSLKRKAAQFPNSAISGFRKKLRIWR